MLQQFLIIPPIFFFFYASGTVEKNRKAAITCVRCLCWNEPHMERKLKPHALIAVKPCSAGQRGGTGKGCRMFPFTSMKLLWATAFIRPVYFLVNRSLMSLWASGATIIPFTHLVLPGKDRCLCKDYMKYISFIFPALVKIHALNLSRRGRIFHHVQLR